MKEKKNVLTGKELITIGIYSAIYFVLNFACMLVSALHPMIWILMPALIALITGIPFMLMCAKVQKCGAVLLMGMITGLLYFVTGQFTMLILITFVLGCGLGELFRGISKYNKFKGNAAAFTFFSLGMVGSPLPIWVMREDFLKQISDNGMPKKYVSTLEAISSPGMLAIMLAVTIICAVIGAVIAKGMFKKHFVKAGIV